MQAVRQQQTEQAATQAAVDAAYAIAQERYRAGLVNYLQVLSTQMPVLTQRRVAVDLAARALDSQAQLLHALGENSL